MAKNLFMFLDYFTSVDVHNKLHFYCLTNNISKRSNIFSDIHRCCLVNLQAIQQVHCLLENKVHIQSVALLG